MNRIQLGSGGTGVCGIGCGPGGAKLEEPYLNISFLIELRLRT